MGTKKIALSIVINILLVVFAIATGFASQTTLIDDFYIKLGAKPEEIKAVFFIINLSLVFFPLGISILIYTIKNVRRVKERDNFCECFKDMLIDKLQDIVFENGGDTFDLNIRLFIPHKKILSNSVVLKIKNIKGFSSPDNTSDLEFEAKPNVQGMVGYCYNSKEVVYEEDLRNSSRNYNLTAYQASKTSQTQFCMCFPIMTKKDKVCLIMTFDSKQVIYIENCLREWKEFIIYFCYKFKENMPHLCK